MIYAVNLISVYPWRHVTHTEHERGAQIIARLLAERFPGMAFSYESGPDFRRGDCHPAMRDSARSFEVKRLVEAELVLEAQANPEGLPKWCAFQYRNGAVCAYEDHDLTTVKK